MMKNARFDEEKVAKERRGWKRTGRFAKLSEWG